MASRSRRPLRTNAGVVVIESTTRCTLGRTCGLVLPARGADGSGGSGEVEQVGPLGLVELQGAGHGVEDVVRDAADVALLQADVPVGADPGQHGDLLAAQPGHPPLAAAGGQPDLLGGELGPTGGQELANLSPVVHVDDGTTAARRKGGRADTPGNPTSQARP